MVTLSKEVYDLERGRKIGRINRESVRRGRKIYHIETYKPDKKIFRVPEGRMFIDEGGRIYIMPKWLHELKVRSIEIIEMASKGYSELTAEEYSEIIRFVAELEKYDRKVKRIRDLILDEMSRLASRRTLEGEWKDASKYIKEPLHKARDYALKVIEIKEKYRRVIYMIHIIAEIKKNIRPHIKNIEHLVRGVSSLTNSLASAAERKIPLVNVDKRFMQGEMSISEYIKARREITKKLSNRSRI